MMNPIEYLWSQVHSAFSGNEFLFLTFGSVSVVTFALIVFNIPFAVVDLTGWPSSLVKYKTQEGKTIPVNWPMYRKTLTLTAFNAVVVSFIVQVMMYPLAVRTISCSLSLPSLPKVVWDFVVCLLVIEVLFYYAHRLFHAPILYKRIHKLHHDWIAPVSVGSIYCHPIEYVFSNLLPVVIGPCVTGSHVTVAWFFYTVVIFFTTLNHCGYHFPFLPSNEFHDFHHAKFNECYGSLGLLDYLHSTDLSFRKRSNYKRHVILTGRDSARELYPDIKKKAEQ
ncbi:fatty acid hydroxylase domain-containing protein 2-like isoform X2 [Halichondria panicea]